MKFKGWRHFRQTGKKVLELAMHGKKLEKGGMVH